MDALDVAESRTPTETDEPQPLEVDWTTALNPGFRGDFGPAAGTSPPEQESRVAVAQTLAEPQVSPAFSNATLSKAEPLRPTGRRSSRRHPRRHELADRRESPDNAAGADRVAADAGDPHVFARRNEATSDQLVGRAG